MSDTPNTDETPSATDTDKGSPATNTDKASFDAGTDKNPSEKKCCTRDKIKYGAIGAVIASSLIAVVVVACCFFARDEKLQEAVVKCQAQDVSKWLGMGADSDDVSEKGIPPLHEVLDIEQACDGANIVRMLIKAGADVNWADREGKTPLHKAIRYNRTDLIRTLIDADANVNLNNIYSKGYTLLTWAIQEGHVDVVEALIKTGASVNKADKSGSDPLHIALEGYLVKIPPDIPKCPSSNPGRPTEERINIARMLIEADAHIGWTDKEGKTLLRKAAENCYVNIVRMLIDAEIKAKRKDEKSGKLLHKAAEKGHGNIVETLIKAGVDVNEADKEGNTPLQKADENCHVNIAKMLICAGANVDRENGGDETPVSLAKQECTNMVEVFHEETERLCD